MEKGLKKIVENSLFNIIVFDYDTLKYLHASETSLNIFGIKPEINTTFYELFPCVDINQIKKKHDNQAPLMGHLNLIEDYSTSFYKVELFNNVYLLLVTAVIVLEDEFSKATDYTKYAVAAMNKNFKFIENDELFIKRFGNSIGRCFNHNFINSFDLIFKRSIEDHLLKTGHYQGVVPLECVNGKYYEHFIIVEERIESSNKVYEIAYFPYEEFARKGKTYLTSDLQQDFIVSVNPNIYSKDKFFQIATKRLIKNGENPCYLIFIDINNFKSINDYYGHLHGDFVIKEIGNILAYVFKGHLICSYGGDKYAIFIETNVKFKKIIDKINRAEKMIQESIRFKPRNVETVLCAGVSRTPINGTNIYDLIKEADIKMYQAKEEEKLYCLGFQEEIE